MSQRQFFTDYAEAAGADSDCLLAAAALREFRDVEHVSLECEPDGTLWVTRHDGETVDVVGPL